MYRPLWLKLPLAAAALLAAGCLGPMIGDSPAAPTSPASSAPTEVDGTWTLISVDNVNLDGTRAPRHGANPTGRLIFDGSGHYSNIVITQGTPEEYKAALEGDNADYGRYTVDAANHAIRFTIEQANHHELNGRSHTRYYTLTGDTLRYTTVRLDANGKAPNTYGEVVLKRATNP